jgi:phospholipase C
MKTIVILFLSLFAMAAPARAITAFSHVIIVIQENRTPDNLFHALCAPPFGTAASCSVTPGPGQYNIQTSGWRDRTSRSGVTDPTARPLNTSKWDISHEHGAWVSQCDRNAAGACRMDGAAANPCYTGSCPPKPAFSFVTNATGLITPYLTLATQYGWANYMFETNQGPSYPAHLYLFSGTSAPSAGDDAAGIFAFSNGTGPLEAGCISDASETVKLLMPDGTITSVYPCFDHETMPDVLGHVTWRYYVTSAAGATKLGFLWNAPLSIQHICQSSGPDGRCLGTEYSNHVDLRSSDVLTDIAGCHLKSLSWVIPTGQNSDHSGLPSDSGGPSWVASIVNAIGTSTSCDGGAGYWKNTAIVITWDDWGGWYDHERPYILSSVQGDFEQGFRVPLIFVSAYTRHLINNERLDFGSILRFVEHNFGAQAGALHFADERANRGLGAFFNLARSPRRFVRIAAPLDAQFFLNDAESPEPPDSD